MDFFNDLGQGKLFNTFRTELGKVGALLVILALLYLPYYN